MPPSAQGAGRLVPGRVSVPGNVGIIVFMIDGDFLAITILWKNKVLVTSGCAG